MKKLIIVFVSSILMLTGFSQNQKFISAMEPKVNAIDSMRDVQGLMELSNSFERIAEVEKTQWLPYYYSALARVNAGLIMSMANGPMGGNAEKTDPEADKADQLIAKAEELSKDNSEIWIVKKLIATLRMIGDPRNRYLTFGAAAEQALQTAKKLNPENPRIYLLQGQDKLYTPEQFGGSKAEAKVLFEEALKKYEAFKPESSIHPNWGRGTLNYLLTQVN